jgi:hypothetical protein
MAKASQQLLLELPPDEVERLAETTVAELGWELSRQPGGRLIVDEDATKLHCHCAPLHAELDLHPTQAGRQTRLTVAGKVAGWGPVASQHVRGQTELLSRRLGLAAIAAVRDRAHGGEPS